MAGSRVARVSRQTQPPPPLSQAHRKPVFSRKERDRALEALVRFSQRAQFTAAARRAVEQFPFGAPAPGGEGEVDVQEQDILFFLHWFLFDFPHRRRTVAERFLAKPDTPLSVGERIWLERMAASSVRLYEITEVRIDEGMTLRDLVDGDIVEVSEKLGTHQLVQWDLLAARLIEGPRGQLEIEGVPLVYATRARSRLELVVRSGHALIAARAAEQSTAARWKEITPVLYALWLDLTVAPPMPTLVTVEGDPVVFVKSVFDVTDPRAVKAALEDSDAFVPVDGGYDWVEEAGPKLRLLGHVTLSGRRLTLEVQSEARAARGRKLLEALVAGLTYRASSEQSVEQMLADAQSAPRRAPPADFPPEVEREIIEEVLEEHYRAWLDEAIPALGGRTPRKAAKLKTWRPQVVDIVKGIENLMERARLEGQPAIDVSWIREELGIARDT